MKDQVEMDSVGELTKLWYYHDEFQTLIIRFEK